MPIIKATAGTNVAKYAHKRSLGAVYQNASIRLSIVRNAFIMITSVLLPDAKLRSAILYSAQRKIALSHTFTGQSRIGPVLFSLLIARWGAML